MQGVTRVGSGGRGGRRAGRFGRGNLCQRQGWRYNNGTYSFLFKNTRKRIRPLFIIITFVELALIFPNYYYSGGKTCTTATQKMRCKKCKTKCKTTQAPKQRPSDVNLYRPIVRTMWPKTQHQTSIPRCPHLTSRGWSNGEKGQEDCGVT